MKQAIETNNFLANNTPPVSPENGDFQQNIRRTNAQRRGKKRCRGISGARREEKVFVRKHNLIVQSRHVIASVRNQSRVIVLGYLSFSLIKSNATNIQSDSLDQSVIVKWCIVTYDNKPYPLYKTSMQTNVKHDDRIENRFYWPMVQDIVWYHHSNFVTLIDSPTKVGSRHYEVDKKVWKRVKDDLGI
ncbi:unnamed protein product [Mytilus coruscus]|uniref:Uncharacterized protein n=1 Tax=Mytilus coruscus TaxID=42192 RepID=A0A6J8ASX4_MYTCO|nr:unnamed protein product [Mytilus coruscus]